jgi:hypothetical protein
MSEIGRCVRRGTSHAHYMHNKVTLMRSTEVHSRYRVGISIDERQRQRPCSVTSIVVALRIQPTRLRETQRLSKVAPVACAVGNWNALPRACMQPVGPKCCPTSARQEFEKAHLRALQEFEKAHLRAQKSR